MTETAVATAQKTRDYVIKQGTIPTQRPVNDYDADSKLYNQTREAAESHYEPGIVTEQKVVFRKP
jgi:hypothetical protein